MVERPSGRRERRRPAHHNPAGAGVLSFRVPSGPLHAAEKRALERASRETSPGGIAQLVERQLCKLDAAGSNPAASTTERRGGRMRRRGRVAQLVRARP